jgi:hypothetical protein
MKAQYSDMRGVAISNPSTADQAGEACGMAVKIDTMANI